MPKKKTDEVEETLATAEETVTEEVAVEAAEAKTTEEIVAADAAPVEEVVEEKPKKTAKAKAPAADTSSDAPAAKQHKRAEKVGIVASDKMTNTVTVRVDRLVKHPVYRKYVKKRKKFMAHDVTGAKIGDKVRIVETRPLSARKRWRVVEIIQKAEL